MYFTCKRLSGIVIVDGDVRRYTEALYSSYCEYSGETQMGELIETQNEG